MDKLRDDEGDYVKIWRAERERLIKASFDKIH